MNRFLVWFFMATLLQAKWFVGFGVNGGAGSEENFMVGSKLYLQHDALPSLTFSTAYNYLYYIQPGITYTQSNVDYSVGKSDTLGVHSASVGVGTTLWAKGSFFLDTAINYIFVDDVTFAGSVTDASFPARAYSAELGLGFSLGSFSFRPYYQFTSFNEDYIVLNETMIELTSQHQAAFELIYWY